MANLEAFNEASSYISRVQDLLAQEQDRTRTEREKLERDFPKIQKFQGKKIKLNVGGKIFVTTIQTLTKDPDSMLASMFSGRFDMTPDEDDAFFIDRDPKYFRFILNFLRTGVPLLPETSLGRKELQLEAEFYNVKAFNTFLVDCSLLNGQQQITLAGWLGGTCMSRTGSLIYKATRDGLTVQNIHDRCDGKGETITVMKTAKGYLFGGYADVSWGSDNKNQWKASSLSFIFAFKSYSQGNTPLKLILSGKQSQYAVNHHPDAGLWFGSGPAIGIQQNSPRVVTGLSTWQNGQTYQFPPEVTENHWLTGEQTFVVSEIEVFAFI